MLSELDEATLTRLGREMSDASAHADRRIRVLEVGFLIGHASAMFLEWGAEVVCFDEAERGVSISAKGHLDLQWPGRHELILGDPALEMALYPGDFFDFAWVGGCRRSLEAGTNLRAALGLLLPDSLVAMPGAVDAARGQERMEQVGPTRAWRSAVSEGLVETLEWCEGFVLGQVIQ